MQVLESAFSRVSARTQSDAWVLVVRPVPASLDDEPEVRGFGLGASDVGEVDPEVFRWPPRAVLLDGLTGADQPRQLLAFLSRAGLSARVPVLLAGTLATIRALADAAVDDFVVAPYRADEVEERLRRLERRRPTALWQRPLATPPVLGLGRLEIDVAAHRAVVDGRAVSLTRLEFALLVFLAQRPQQVFTRAQLLAEVWESDSPTGGRTVDIHVRRLRAKLRGTAPIETVRGIGYRLGK